MSNQKLAAILIVFVVMLTLILAPVGLLTGAAAGSSQIGMSSAKGTVWSGIMNGVSLAGTPLGDLNVGLSPLALMTGQIRVGVRRSPVADARAVLLQGRRATGVEGLNLRTPIDLAETGLPLTGVVTFTEVLGVFRQDRCDRAGGKIKIILAGDGPLQGAILSGVPVCQSGMWVVTLVGAAGDAKVTLAARIDSRGRYQLEMMVATFNEAMIQVLLGNGFLRDAIGARRTVEGRLAPSEEAVTKKGVEGTP